MHAMQRRLLALALYCLAENDDDESVDLQALQTRASPLVELWHFAEEAPRAVPQVRTDAGHTREGDRRRRRRHGKLTRFPKFKKVGPKLRSGSYDSMPSWTRRRVGPDYLRLGCLYPVLF